MAGGARLRANRRTVDFSRATLQGVALFSILNEGAKRCVFLD
ncbi:hypothetical protein ARMA_0709 [Ardenticatena maritima]|uniref:Uncharacterized protein n=1 Tax=Ardenticatena maritima TaxID=872965 RepID=A0A0M8K886_9CHLR|nr:hypothetical protein ARMA_0709 [Ardenticatena maritima]